MFDYQGYTAETLERLCDQRRAVKGLCRRLYGQTEMYSFGQYYREETAYPHTLPLYIYSQHGANQTDIGKFELEHDAEAMLVWNTDRQREYQKLSDRPCYVVTCPYVSHRRRLGITRDPAARGTLIFPAHSTRGQATGFDVEAYIAEILALPAEFQPVAVCLFVHDVRLGAHHAYMEKGLPVYSAGDIHDVSFGDRLYEVMRHFRYTMSNTAGSYAYYSVEMGTPFSLWGEEAKRTLRNAHPQASVAPGNIQKPHPADAVFSGFHTEITPEQKEFVEFSMGVGQGISREELAKVFWDAYRKRGHPVRDALVTARLRLKYAVNKIRYGN